MEHASCFVSRKVLHSLSRSIPRVQIKNRFSPTISALIGAVRLSKVRYIDAVKLILQKSVPEEVHPVPIKRPSYAPASTLVFLFAFSLLPFESKEPFIEENHFNVPFDVTAAVTFFCFITSKSRHMHGERFGTRVTSVYLVIK